MHFVSVFSSRYTLGLHLKPRPWPIMCLFLEKEFKLKSPGEDLLYWILLVNIALCIGIQQVHTWRSATGFPDRSALLGGASDLEQHLCDQLPNFNVNFARHDYGVSYRPGHTDWGQIVLEGAFKFCEGSGTNHTIVQTSLMGITGPVEGFENWFKQEQVVSKRWFV